MYRVLSASILALALTPAVSSQTKYTTMPAGSETKAADSYAIVLGAYQEGRYQLGDGTLKGQPLSMVSLFFRENVYQTFNTTSGMGRSWSNVTLDLCETNIDKMTTSWAGNQLTKPTRVFSAPMTWPTLSGYKNSTSFGLLRFTFSKPWTYSGKNDACFEYNFTNGKLANGYTGWKSSTPSYYYLDSVNVQTSITGNGGYLPTSFSCKNTGSSYFAYSYGSATRYADKHVSVGWEDMMLIYYWSQYIAPEATAIQLLCFAGNTTGVNVGTCNKLYLNLNTVLQMTRRTTNKAGYTSYATNDGYYLLPYYPPWSGAKLWTQAAYSDTKTGYFSLTAARWFEIPKPTPKLNPIRKRMTLHYDKDATTSWFVTYSTVYQHMPLVGYR